MEVHKENKVKNFTQPKPTIICSNHSTLAHSTTYKIFEMEEMTSHWLGLSSKTINPLRTLFKVFEFEKSPKVEYLSKSRGVFYPLQKENLTNYMNLCKISKKYFFLSNVTKLCE